MSRKIIRDGPHTTEVLNVLRSEIKSPSSLNTIADRAAQIIERSVDPIGGPPDHPNDGLLYGLIQSGKTSVITVAAAIAADNGFRCIVILTSDIDLLYDQTLERIKRALRGLTVLGKNDWKDADRFERNLRTTPLVVVCSKNGSKLKSLLDAFMAAGAKGLSTFIIDDEADQASLNTFTSKGGDQISRVNKVITDFRNYFPVNTYLQVTATPQALVLQRPDHRYRPSFTILSKPGPGYVGGDEFFGPESSLLRHVDLQEVNSLLSTHQPNSTGTVPAGLARALYTFLVSATYGVVRDPETSFAFLCHVSLNKKDHDHIVRLIDRFKEDTINALQNPGSSRHEKVLKGLRSAYDDLKSTEPGLPALEEIVSKVRFYLPGTNVKLVNASSNEEVKLDSVYNIFVGGNKLGRGVTIKNLLVSYYGRNPKRPNSDTVLQHARMYGYRQKDISVTRLFLPEKLAEHFRLIHQMESALRDLVGKYPDGKFEGLYISAPLQATRKNVLDPNAIGYYVSGKMYNPTYPLRTAEVRSRTEAINSKLTDFTGFESGKETTIPFVIELLEECPPDPKTGSELWNIKTLKAALEKIQSLRGNKAYLVVRRGRNLTKPRRETQGIHDSGEDGLAPLDAPTLFMYHQNAHGKEGEVWWPQLRFPESPDGNYVLAFSFSR